MLPSVLVHNLRFADVRLLSAFGLGSLFISATPFLSGFMLLRCFLCVLSKPSPHTTIPVKRELRGAGLERDRLATALHRPAQPHTTAHTPDSSENTRPPSQLNLQQGPWQASGATTQGKAPGLWLCA
eukprot:m.107875 g.107875  ORF g.107875 m.107875 type:complete len:127 (-) comp51713_c0_seq6:399-779(-)